MKEKWRFIPDLDKRYAVSNFGRVYSHVTKKFMSLSDNGKGYKTVMFTYNGKSFRRYAHRLVAECFLMKVDGMNEVNHKDGNKANNHYSNIEWSNRSLNNLHAVKTGLRKPLKGERHQYYGKRRGLCHASKKIGSRLHDKIFPSILDAAEYYGLSHSAICAMLKGVNFNRLEVYYI